MPSSGSIKNNQARLLLQGLPLTPAPDLGVAICSLTSTFFLFCKFLLHVSITAALLASISSLHHSILLISSMFLYSLQYFSACRSYRLTRKLCTYLFSDRISPMKQLSWRRLDTSSDSLRWSSSVNGISLQSKVANCPELNFFRKSLISQEVWLAANLSQMDSSRKPQSFRTYTISSKDRLPRLIFFCQFIKWFTSSSLSLAIPPNRQRQPFYCYFPFRLVLAYFCWKSQYSFLLSS